MLLDHGQLTIPDADVVELARKNFRTRPAVSFPSGYVALHASVMAFTSALLTRNGQRA
jgi:hypothetical protein